jgi:sarcosine oxidase gamma subunit
MTIEPLAAAVTLSSTSNNIGNAKNVFITNGSNATVTITLTTSADAAKATFTLGAGQSVICQKASGDKLATGGSTVTATLTGFTN